MVHIFTSLATLGSLVSLAAASPVTQSPPLRAVPLIEHLSRADVHTDIINGVEVGPNEFHALVVVEGNGVLCTGTLVSKNLVVTAGHCALNRAASTFSILLGTHDKTQGGSRTGVSQVFVHPNYHGAGTGSDFDIALLRLSQSFEQTPTIGYAKLPAQGSDPKASDTAVSAGWGGVNDGSLPNKARKVEMPFRSRADCQAYYGTASVTDNTICAGGLGGGNGLCGGDSGGPTLNKVNGNFVGVNSFGAASKCGAGPSGFVRVGNFVDWINSHK